MSTESEKAAAVAVLAEQCHYIRTQHICLQPHRHVSHIVSAAQRTATLVAQGHLDEEQMRTALLAAAEEFITNPQCACTRASIAGHIDAALVVARGTSSGHGAVNLAEDVGRHRY